MQFIGCLFSIFLLALFILLSFGLSIVNFVLRLFGINTLFPFHKHEEEQSSAQHEPQKRVFEDNEGEYVDFEEV